ncbi:dorsal-ventral patterning tolloid-like protein 1 isoform X2 [Exaiptasia diaphana]|uniref:CUB domain-containing protein n=1 Tax=Exaiptasia diaphana TaxID=2652724 RepID=A0A913Y4F9_EXADI|nr:dorsal-ventral patterning tolloid-like protein 1 isoform X2 [Exaiptasia diaphana]
MANTAKTRHLISLIAILVGLFLKLSQARRCPTSGILAGYSGVLSSPYYPEEYPHRVDCDWIIIVPQGHHIKLTFTDFDIEYCMFCKCDYVEIRDGKNSSSPFLGKFCRKGRLSAPMYSTGRYLWIKFYSDVGGRFQGFRALYKAIKTGPIYNGIIHKRGISGVVTSPKTIAACGPDRECTWLISVRKSNQIKIQFSRIVLPKCSTPCGCSNIEIRDGINSTGRLIAKFCDSIHKPENICSTTNHLWIKYQYGLDLAQYGFRASYQKWQCRDKKEDQTTIETTTGTLDTVVGLICASFVFMAFMTLCMVCIASRKLACNKKTRNSMPHHLVTREHAAILAPPPQFIHNTCHCHKHAHLHYTKGSETDYSDETEQYVCDSGTEFPVHFCRNCKIGSAKHTKTIIEHL